MYRQCQLPTCSWVNLNLNLQWGLLSIQTLDFLFNAVSSFWTIVVYSNISNLFQSEWYYDSIYTKSLFLKKLFNNSRDHYFLSCKSIENKNTIQRIFGVNLNYFNIEAILNSKYMHTTIKSCKPYNFFSCAIWHKQFEIPVRIIPPLILSLLYIELLLPYIVKYDVAFVCTKPSLMYFR